MYKYLFASQFSSVSSFFLGFNAVGMTLSYLIRLTASLRQHRRGKEGEKRKDKEQYHFEIEFNRAFKFSLAVLLYVV